MTKRILYLDLVGGAAGDMLLAALLDAGASHERVRAAVETLGLHRVQVEVKEVRPAGLRALQVDVLVDGVLADTESVSGGGHHVHEHASPHSHDDHHHEAHDGHHHAAPEEGGHHAHGHRPYSEIRNLLRTADLAPSVRDIALDAFARLAGAESKAHGIDVESVIFHEVGADDAITDIVAVATAVVELAPDEVIVSPVPLGRGLTHGAHGPIPLPGPAVLHLLQGAPTAQTALIGETVTPTGAALLAALVHRYGPVPPMTIEQVGVGAGHIRWPDRPNIVRAFIGQRHIEAFGTSQDDCVIESNIDDMSPELFEGLQRALFEAGALDVWTTPIHMKKGRVGMKVSVLTERAIEDAIVAAFFAHSTTLGVRIVDVRRIRAARSMRKVTTPYGEIRIKISPRPYGPELVTPEYDDCQSLAQISGVPLRTIYESAMKVYWSESSE